MRSLPSELHGLEHRESPSHKLLIMEPARPRAGGGPAILAGSPERPRGRVKELERHADRRRGGVRRHDPRRAVVVHDCEHGQPCPASDIEHGRPHRRHAPLPRCGRIELPRELNQLFRGLEGKGTRGNVGAAREDWAKGSSEVPVVCEDLESLDVGRMAVLGGWREPTRIRDKKTTPRGAEMLNPPASPFGSGQNGETCTATRLPRLATSSLQGA